MRLGKEQAVGYVEDTGADAVAAEETTIEQSQPMPPTPAPEPALTVS